MGTAISLKNVTKHFDTFTLNNVTLDIPKGCIVGLVGENGAGKTTLLKLILQLFHCDGGEIRIDGVLMDELPVNWKNNVGAVITGLDFASGMCAVDVGKCMHSVFAGWQQETYEQYLKRFHIDPDKKIKDYSQGMKMKLNIIIAMSHNASLLIMDEATSGLDPVVRDDILELLLEFIQDEEHTVLISSHITSDLEKAADYIAYLDNGELRFCLNKDEMLYDYGVVRCTREDYEQLPKKHVKGVRRNHFEYEVLVENRMQIKSRFPKLAVDTTNIEEIILFMVKGERV
ncbi:ABC transporter ATP-binding protein [Ruminococcus sp. OA3]|uniref:ABC transporter ATP-binding protein n=1 Tax=Ruminococcus sp. OA3 TaxID=2914164 RepID=UPI001F0591C1|nr:ABC transporter ATP-binding protein [Ruminococcus sp. OA3]MCH1983222.1 ABC transporter ATP-binding protein [Ruminococcus sp. OA3]